MAVSHFHHLLYGSTVTILTDHAAVKAVLECPNPTAKYARWWTRVYSRGIKQVKLCYRAGKENKGADALSRISHTTSPEVGTVDGEIQVATVTAPDILIDPHTDRVAEVQVTTVTVSDIPIDRPHTERVATSPGESQTSEPESTRSHPNTITLPDTNYGNARGQRPNLEQSSEHSSASVRILTDSDTGSSQQQEEASDTESLPGEREDVESEQVDNCDIGKEQDKDLAIREIKEYLRSGVFPRDEARARRLALRESQFSLIDIMNQRPGICVPWHQAICVRSYSGSPMEAGLVDTSLGGDSLILFVLAGGGSQC